MSGIKFDKEGVEGGGGRRYHTLEIDTGNRGLGEIPKITALGFAALDAAVTGDGRSLVYPPVALGLGDYTHGYIFVSNPAAPPQSA